MTSANPMLNHLIEAQLQEGPLSFAEFMQLVLYTPELGYYSGSQPKIGAAGDFITAPALSPLFGQCLALQCREILNTLPNAGIVEIGAGLGTLAADILQTLAAHNALPARYDIIEISPWLQEQQRQHLARTCPQWLDRIHWRTTPMDQGFQGIILGNEIIDALPIHRFRMVEGQPRELGVTLEQDRLVDCLLDNPTLTAAVNALQSRLGPLPDGFTSEIHLSLPHWLREHTAALKAGVVLLVDYGYPQAEYYHPTRATGTLRCHYQHQAHDNPFLHLGQQDLTAHVDFTALAEAGLDAGLELSGYTTQARFLLSLGLEALKQAQIQQNPAQELAIQHQVKRLTHPLLMGELFKVIAFNQDYSQPLSGFKLGNLTHLL